jgi:4-hydroxy-3-polyprenylbenzoate decarboxylase
MATRIGGAGGYRHYLKHQRRGEREMPCAIALGCPPCVAYVAPMKLPLDLDEIGVAGGLAGEPIRVVRGKTVDLLVPAEAEIVIEGMLDTEYLEPEGPFGESHGHIALEEFNIPMRVTAITHRRHAIVASYLSQVTPSESSAIKRVSYEPMFLAHLRNTLGIRTVKRVKLHERLTAIRRVIVVTMEKDAPRSEIWRALYGASRPTAARSALPSTRTSIRTIPTQFSGRSHSAWIPGAIFRCCRTAARATGRSASTSRNAKTRHFSWTRP